MKTSTILLALSLAANAALLAVLGWRVTGGAVEVPQPDAAGAALRPLKAAEPAGNNPPGAMAAAGVWARLRTDDLTVLVARLRAAGFPPDVVLDMARALVGERFDARRLALSQAEFARPIWKRPGRAASDAKKYPEWRKLALEEDAMLHELIGPGYAALLYATDDDAAWQGRRSGPLEPGKLDQLHTARMNYEWRQAELQQKALVGDSYVPVASDHAQQVQLEQAYRAELAQFMSPAEVNEVMLRNGSVSRDVGYMLTPMKLTEEQYRTVYPLYQALQDQNPALDLLSYNPATASPAERVAVEQVNAQVAALLGPDRAADLQQVFSAENHNLNSFINQLDLPISVATNVGAVQQDIQQRAAALRADPSLTVDARRAQLAALAKEASTKLSTALGAPSNFAAYSNNYPGWWLKRLTQ